MDGFLYLMDGCYDIVWMGVDAMLQLCRGDSELHPQDDTKRCSKLNLFPGADRGTGG